MKTIDLVVLCCLTATLLPQTAARAEEAVAPVTPVAVADAVAEMGQDVWPGFDPAAYPLAIYDRESTWLFRHPQPPNELGPVEGRDDARRMIGRHPAMVANTSIELGGVPTATLFLDPEVDRSLRQAAGLAIHELFHVHQRQAMPKIHANEADLFDYPVADPEVLSLRRLETACLYRAAAAEDPDRTDGWLAEALELRRRRYAKMEARHARYEQSQELNEGLAQYVEDRVSGTATTSRFPDGGWSPQDARSRCYTSGQVLALALDRNLPGWKAEVVAGEMTALDEPLAAALAERGISPTPLDSAQHAAIDLAARADAERFQSQLQSIRAAFEGAPGWRLRIEVGEGAPLLGLRGFDPLNVLVLGEGLVLHQRMLQLGGERGELEVLDAEAVTYGPGEHPLFSGVGRVEVAGLFDQPRPQVEGHRVELDIEGVRLQLEGAKVASDPDRRLVVIQIEP